MAGTEPSVDSQDVLRFSVALARLTRWLRSRSAQERTNMGAGSVSALVTLTQSGPMRLKDLATRERIAPPTLSRIIATLEENDYAARRPDPQDRRAALVHATAKGEQTARDLRSLRTQSLRERMGQLPSEDLATLLAAIPILEAMVEDDT